MQILEDHNKQLEAQLQRLRQLLDQVSSENLYFNINFNQAHLQSMYHLTFRFLFLSFSLLSWLLLA